MAIAMLVSLVGTQMQNAAIDWHVWVLTRSPLALGFVGLVRIVPIVVLSPVGLTSLSFSGYVSFEEPVVSA